MSNKKRKLKKLVAIALLTEAIEQEELEQKKSNSNDVVDQFGRVNG